MKLRDDLEAIRDLVQGGAHWLAATIEIAPLGQGDKRFLQVYEALRATSMRARSGLSLTDFFFKQKPEDVAAFFDAAIGGARERTLPSWPTLHLPEGRRS